MSAQPQLLPLPSVVLHEWRLQLRLRQPTVMMARSRKARSP
jgi:hypothetical protein